MPSAHYLSTNRKRSCGGYAAKRGLTLNQLFAWQGLAIPVAESHVMRASEPGRRGVQANCLFLRSAWRLPSFLMEPAIPWEEESVICRAWVIWSKKQLELSRRFRDRW